MWRKRGSNSAVPRVEEGTYDVQMTPDGRWYVEFTYRVGYDRGSTQSVASGNTGPTIKGVDVYLEMQRRVDEAIREHRERKHAEALFNRGSIRYSV